VPRGTWYRHREKAEASGDTAAYFAGLRNNRGGAPRPWKDLGVPKSTWWLHRKRAEASGDVARYFAGLPKRSDYSSSCPWEELGVSYATYQRRIADAEASGDVAAFFASLSTRANVARRRAAIREIVEAMHPMIVRQVYYQATVRGIVEKTDGGYDMVAYDLTLLRRSGEIPWDWIVDNLRECHRPWTCSSIEEALEAVAQQYRKSLWDDADCEVQIWLEKDSLANIIEPITRRYDVPLCVARGYSSLSFTREMARSMSDEVPVHVYHLGDLDPSGENAGEVLERTLREFAPDAEIHFKRLAVTPQQIKKWNLPSRPNKKDDSRTEAFEKKGHMESVELDAIDPNKLRKLVEYAIRQHMPPDVYADLMRQEQREKRAIRKLVDNIDLNDIEDDEEDDE
jgi:ribosomal protein S10